MINTISSTYTEREIMLVCLTAVKSCRPALNSWSSCDQSLCLFVIEIYHYSQCLHSKHVSFHVRPWYIGTNYFDLIANTKENKESLLMQKYKKNKKIRSNF